MIAGRCAVVLAAALAFGGCRKNSSGPSPEVSGLAAVPASAEVVLAVDVPRVMGSPLVERAVDALLARDPDLAARWQKLHDSCKLDLDQIKHVVLAIGPSRPAEGATPRDSSPAPPPGTGPVLAVATGKLSETDFARCVRDMVGQGGGSLTAKDVAGRTLYEAKDGKRTMYFAFGKPDTVVLGSNEAFVTEALGAGKKALDNPELKHWIELADQNAPMWGAGRVDERVRQGLVRVTNGQLKAGPTAIVMSADTTKGAKLDVGLVMATPEDAKTLESFANTQKGLLGYAAQVKRLGTLVDKLAISATGDLVRFRIDVGVDELNQLLSTLDGKGSAAQDSSPPR
ncbi:MAG: hypothetical protein ACM31C_26300 [Acidobacteriota bacterium]